MRLLALFLGVVLAVFLTLGAVRGDAERGLLQPLVVRPVGRTTLLIGRLLAASAVCAPYVVIVFLLAALTTQAAGDFTPRTFVVQIINDQVGELTEDLGLFLINPVGESAPGPLGTSSLVILDDDSSFSFDNTAYFVNEGQTNAVITIVRTGFAVGPASVTFATGDGTARAGFDYTFTTVLVNFADGETVKTVLVPIIDDDDKREVVIGMSEGCIIPAVGALVNAVFNATGLHVRELPITPDKILMGLNSSKVSTAD